MSADTKWIKCNVAKEYKVLKSCDQCGARRMCWDHFADGTEACRPCQEHYANSESEYFEDNH